MQHGSGLYRSNTENTLMKSSPATIYKMTEMHSYLPIVHILLKVRFVPLL